MNYDPIFDQSKRPLPDHECQWEQHPTNWLIETCVVPGCSQGRYSRNWLNSMRLRERRWPYGVLSTE